MLNLTGWVFYTTKTERSRKVSTSKEMDYVWFLNKLIFYLIAKRTETDGEWKVYQMKDDGIFGKAVCDLS